jgi:protein arginine kinase activator
MAMEKCQFCGKPATVHMTQITNNKTTVVRMCNECAAQRGLCDKGLPLAMLSSLGEALFAGMRQNATIGGLICSKCGCTPMSFKETGRLGCPNCYKDLELLVDGIIESSQKGALHKGKRPKHRGRISDLEKKGNDASCDRDKKNGIRRGKELSKSEKLDELQSQLNEAVKGERYEEAAKLRDEMNTLKGNDG